MNKENTKIEGVKNVTIYVMGKAYEVPSDQTIMGALEYAGYQLIRDQGVCPQD